MVLFVAVAGCSQQRAAPCSAVLVDGTIVGNQVSPAVGATNVPTTLHTIVFNEEADYSIVLRALNGSPAGYIQTTPAALPSPYQTSSPGSGTTGYYAVSVPTLAAGTTYATGSLSDINQCAGDDKFYQFGTFTTQ